MTHLLPFEDHWEILLILHTAEANYFPEYIPYTEAGKVEGYVLVGFSSYDKVAVNISTKQITNYKLYSIVKTEFTIDYRVIYGVHPSYFTDSKLNFTDSKLNVNCINVSCCCIYTNRMYIYVAWKLADTILTRGQSDNDDINLKMSWLYIFLFNLSVFTIHIHWSRKKMSSLWPGH